MLLEEIKENVRDIVAQEIIPLEARWHHEGWDKVIPHLDAIRSKVKAQGLWTPQIPAAHGGIGLSVAEFGGQAAGGLFAAVVGRYDS